MVNHGKKNVFGVQVHLLLSIGIFGLGLPAALGNIEYLLVRITTPSRSPTYYLLYPFQKNASLCTLIENEESDPSMPPKCPEQRITRARRLSNGLTDPSSEHYSAFSTHQLHHVQIMNGGYLYRHPKHKHCIYWVPIPAGEQVPVHCTGFTDEILQFSGIPSDEHPPKTYLYMTIRISDDETVMRAVRISENEEDLHYPEDEFEQICVTENQITFCALLRGNDAITNRTFRFRADYQGYFGTGPHNMSATACFVPSEISWRSQFAKLNNKIYILGIAGGCSGEILEYDMSDKIYRVVWQANPGFYSQEHHISFAILKEQMPFSVDQISDYSACKQCLKSCLMLITSSSLETELLCPFVTRASVWKWLSRFVVYDESWELPLLGRDHLELAVEDAVDSRTGNRFRHVSNMAAMNKEDSLCWTYKGDEDVRCRSLLQEQNHTTVVGKIYPSSTMLVFGLNGDEMFYNDGDCGQPYVYSFRVGEEYRFPHYSGPLDLSCESRVFALDTENKILFWVANNTVSAHVLFTGDPGNNAIDIADTEIVSTDVAHSIAVDMERKVIFTYSSNSIMCRINYTRILGDKDSEIGENYCKYVNSRHRQVSQLQVRGEYLFGISRGFAENSRSQDPINTIMFYHAYIEEDGHDLDGFQIVDLLQVHSADISGYLNWTYITKGITLNRYESEALPLSNVHSKFSRNAQNITAREASPFQRLIILSPARIAGIEVNPCAKSRCRNDSFCFIRFPLKAETVCVCRGDVGLINDTVCIAPDPSDSSHLDWFIPVTISMSVLLFATVCVVSFFLYRSSRQNAELRRIVDDIHKGDPEAEASAQTMADKVLHQPLTCTISSKDLVIDRKSVLGEGNFGLVLKGTYKVMDVAIKTLKSPVNHTFLADMVKEAKIMNYIGDHPHIVKMYGAEVSQVEQGKMFIALEFSPVGCLLTKLKKMNRTTGSQSTPGTSLTSNNYQNSCMETAFVAREKLFLDWAKQIANGMHYLSTKNVFHGDLAARNILVFPNDVLKISDFGLSRRLSNYSNYTKGNQTPLPWRWMAYESLTRLEFSIKSDVWAYGVTLWEIFTLGDLPYPNKEWNEEFVNGLASNEVLSRPAHASQSTYERLIRPCWILKLEERPDFAQILHTLSEL